MKQVYVGKHYTDLHFLKSLLEDEGIKVLVRGEGLPGVLPSLWVLEDDDVERASLTAADYASGRPVESHAGWPWKCANCREIIEEQFTQCWNCGASRA